jgi:ferritin-like metal-binding protein YciE
MGNTLFTSLRNTLHFHQITTLEELFIEQLRDLYSAETQLIEALPLMAKAAHSSELKTGFKKHLQQTREHASRLKKILSGLKQEAGGKKCQAMAGLVKEGNETISEDAIPAVKDAALIAAAQRVEHYEIAGYGTVRTFASLLGNRKAAALLGKTLQEEAATDKKLTAVAKKLNVKAPRAKTSRGAKTPSSKK